MNAFIGISEKLRWRTASETAIELAEKSAAVTKEVRAAINELPQDGFIDLWYCPTDHEFSCRFTKNATQPIMMQWAKTLSKYASACPFHDEVPYRSDLAKVAERSLAARCFLEKQAESPTMSALAKITGMKKGLIPGAPNALIGSLTGGLLGAGLGYGAGWLGEKFLPEDWKKGRLRRTLAIMGGLVGAAPGAIGMYQNYRSGRPFYKNAPPPKPGEDLNLMTDEQMFRRGAGPDPAATWEQKYLPKTASFTGWDGGALPQINVPAFARDVWSDPFLAPQMQAATAGIVQGASALAGGARLISPLDVARMTAGMGTGYLSGALVGKVLGLLTGMPSGVQQKLRNAGTWAGIVSNIVPIAFR